MNSEERENVGEAPADAESKILFEWKFKGQKCSAVLDGNCTWDAFVVNFVDRMPCTITYVDSDDDEIPIDSRSEFEEALRSAKRRQNWDKVLEEALILAESQQAKVGKSNLATEAATPAKESIEILEKVDPAVVENFGPMPPMRLDSGEESFATARQNPKTVYNVTEPESPSDGAPKWFMDYMETMKKEIVNEVTEKVTKTMLEALKNPESNCSTRRASCPRRRGIDTNDRTRREVANEWDSDCDGFDLVNPSCFEQKINKSSTKSSTDRNNRNLENSKGGPRSADSRGSCEGNCEWQLPNYSDYERDFEKTNEWLENTKDEESQYLKNRKNNEEKVERVRKSSDKKKSSRNQDNPESEKSKKKNDGYSWWNLRFNPTANDDEDDENSEFSNCEPEPCAEDPKLTENSKKHDPKNSDDEFDTPYRKMIASGIHETSFVPLDSENTSDVQILKLRMVNSSSNGNYGSEKENGRLTAEEKARMSCSVTGNKGSPEETHKKMDESSDFSDSDNISFISDDSNRHSDEQRIDRTFELVLQRSMHLNDDNTEKNEEKKNEEKKNSSSIAEEEKIDNAKFQNNVEESDDLADSLPELININDDYYPAKYEDSYGEYMPEFHEDTGVTIGTIWVANPEGVIFPGDVDPVEDTIIEDLLEKRAGGAYSFVGENVPVVPDCESIHCGDPEPRVEEKSKKKEFSRAIIEESSEGDPVDPVSSRSFDSHTTQREDEKFREETLEDKRQSSAQSEEPRSHIFVDHSVTKGLGDTRQASPRGRKIWSPSQKFNDRTDDKMRQDCRGHSGSSDSRHAKISGLRSSRLAREGLHCDCKACIAIWGRAMGIRGVDPYSGHTCGQTFVSGHAHEAKREKRSNRLSNLGRSRLLPADDVPTINGLRIVVPQPMQILPETFVTSAVRVAEAACRVYEKFSHTGNAFQTKRSEKSKSGGR